MKTKVCGKCTEVKSLEDFYPSKTNRFGRAYLCKICNNAGCRERHLIKALARPKKEKAPPPTEKPCKICLAIKPVSDFFARKASPDGLAYLCKICDTANRKLRKLANPEAEQEIQRKWRERNAEKKKTTDRRLYLENLEVRKVSGSEYYLKHKVRIAERSNGYYLLKKADFLARARTRKISKLRATPSWADLEAIKEIYRRCEAISIATGIPHHVDHEIPLQGKLVCGLHVHTNLQIITAVENLKKQNKYEIS